MEQPTNTEAVPAPITPDQRGQSCTLNRPISLTQLPTTPPAHSGCHTCPSRRPENPGTPSQASQRSPEGSTATTTSPPSPPPDSGLRSETRRGETKDPGLLLDPGLRSPDSGPRSETRRGETQDPGRSSLPIPKLFDPPESSLSDLFHQLDSPYLSLIEVAQNHKTSLTALSLWLARPDIQERQQLFNSTAAARTRNLAISRLHKAVHCLELIVDAVIEDETRTPIPGNHHKLQSCRRRSRETARKAAWLLIQLTRFHPRTTPQKSSMGFQPMAQRPTTEAASSPHANTSPECNERGATSELNHRHSAQAPAPSPDSPLDLIAMRAELHARRNATPDPEPEPVTPPGAIRRGESSARADDDKVTVAASPPPTTNGHHPTPTTPLPEGLPGRSRGWKQASNTPGPTNQNLPDPERVVGAHTNGYHPTSTAPPSFSSALSDSGLRTKDSGLPALISPDP